MGSENISVMCLTENNAAFTVDSFPNENATFNCGFSSKCIFSFKLNNFCSVFWAELYSLT